MELRRVVDVPLLVDLREDDAPPEDDVLAEDDALPEDALSEYDSRVPEPERPVDRSEVLLRVEVVDRSADDLRASDVDRSEYCPSYDDLRVRVCVPPAAPLPDDAYESRLYAPAPREGVRDWEPPSAYRDDEPPERYESVLYEFTLSELDRRYDCWPPSPYERYD